MQHIFLILFLLFSLPLSASDWKAYQKSGDRSAGWDGFVEEGFKTAAAADNAMALRLLKRATSAGCRDGMVFYTIAQIEESRGNKPRAVEWYKMAKPELEKRYPKHPITQEVGQHLALLYFQSENYSLALPLLLEANERLGKNFERLYLIGQIYRLRGEKETAIATYEEALAIQQPINPTLKLAVQIELLNLYQATKQEAKLEQLSAIILEEHPDNPAARAIQENIQHRKATQQQQEEWERILNSQ